MANIEELSDALQNAHAAGDTAAARMLADEIVKHQSGAQPQQPGAGMDFVKSAGVGIGKGAIGLLGLPGDIPSLVEAGLNKGNEYLVSKGIGVPRDRTHVVENPFPGSADIQKSVEGYTGEFYKPQTTAGKYAETVGEFAPGLIAGPGGFARRALTQVLAPGLASEAAGQAAKTYAPDLEPYARVGGAVAGAGLGAIGQRALTPLPTDANRQALVAALRGEGVTGLTAGQVTGRKSLQYSESMLGDFPGAGGGAQQAQEAAGRQFTEAATRRAGFEGLANPENLAGNQARLGNEFNTLSARNTLVPDQQFVTDLTNTAQRYVSAVLPSQRAGGTRDIQTIMQDVIAEMQANGGQLPGVMYQGARSRLGTQALAAEKSDHHLATAIRGIRDALDDAMARSINPADAEAWATARQQYGAQKVLEKTAARAGAPAAEGIVTPQALRGAVTQGGNNSSRYARGEGQFAELARAGNALMTPLPNSGTAQRAAVTGLASALSGGAAGLATGGLAAPSAAVVAGAVAPSLMGRALMSRPVQGWLGNQLLDGPRDLSREALAAALLGSQSSQGPLRITVTPRPQIAP